MESGRRSECRQPRRSAPCAPPARCGVDVLWRRPRHRRHAHRGGPDIRQIHDDVRRIHRPLCRNAEAAGTAARRVSRRRHRASHRDPQQRARDPDGNDRHCDDHSCDSGWPHDRGAAICVRSADAGARGRDRAGRGPSHGFPSRAAPRDRDAPSVRRHRHPARQSGGTCVSDETNSSCRRRPTD